MKYYKNLLQPTKVNHKLNFCGGILFLICAVSWLIIHSKPQAELFDWFYFGVFALIAILHILSGLGFPVEQLIGKAYILIDEKKIHLKLNYLSKTQISRWEEISAISHAKNQFVFIKKDASSLSLPISKLEYAEVQKLKKIILELCESKGITMK